MLNATEQEIRFTHIPYLISRLTYADIIIMQI